MKVLFCTDGTSIANNAILNYLKWFNNVEVDIISVSDMTNFDDNIFIHSDKLIELCANNADVTLKSANKFLNDNEITVKQVIKRCGGAVDNILDVGEKNNYDCIILGSNGKKGIQKWLGSVSQDVASKSNTSIYISKKNQQTKKILFALSQDMYMKNNIDKLISNMNLTQSDITLMTVYQMPDFLFLSGNVDQNWITDIELKQQKESKSLINSIEKIFISKGITVKEKIIIKGNSSEEILNYSEANDISLIVVGTSKERKYSGNNSVSKRILEFANCDVYIDKYI